MNERKRHTSRSRDASPDHQARAEPGPGSGSPDDSGASDGPTLSLPSAILSWTQHWIALDKPSGLPSRPAPGHPDSALAAIERWLQENAPGDGRPGVVHRLDLSTSGVLLFSLSPEAHRALREAWTARSVRKEYSALVIGWPQPRRGLIDLRLRRNASGTMVLDGHGMEAVTRYETIARYGAASWVRVQPLTGRMHQIRVHLAARGSPVLGDRRYGPRHIPPGLPVPPRLCLHAERLVLPAPLVRSLKPEEKLPGAVVSGPEGRWTILAPEPEPLARYRKRLAGAHG